MQTYDPRLWCIRHPRAVVCLFLFWTVVFIWGNAQVERGGILDEDVILRQDDPFSQMDRYVRAKVTEGFEGREFIPFIFNHGGLQSPSDLQKVFTFTKAAQNTFGDTILSLSTVPHYQDTGESLLDEPYITESEYTPAFDFHKWKLAIADDPGVFGLFVGRDFSWATVIRYLPPGYNEIHEFRKTVEFLEGREIPWWEWLWKKDIHPQDSSLGVGGWTVGRGLIDQGLNVDVLTLVGLGVVLTLPVFWLAFGSWRLAFLSVTVMILGGFVWTRGTMGVLGVQERVFSLLVYANVIVQGTSFALHKFAAFRESQEQDRQAAWQEAAAVDGVLMTVAGIAAFGFAILLSFGLKPILELGVTSALGVLWLLLLATCVLPAFHQVCGGQAPERVVYLYRWNAVRRRASEQIVGHCARLATWLAKGKRPWAVGIGVGGVFLTAAWLFMQGAIVSRTRALEFIPGTLVEQEARFLNRPGNVGFEFLDLLIEPAQGGGMMDPHFLSRAWEFQTALKRISGSRETSSILSSLHQIAKVSFHKPFPETLEEVHSAFFLVESRLSPAVQRQLYFPAGVRVAVSYGTDDTVELGRLCQDVLTLAQQEFPDLRVSAFNKVPLYPQVDHYVRQGKVTNVFSSQVGIAIMCGALVFWHNRRRQRQRLSSVRAGLVMSVPLLFATAAMGLLMWGLDIPLDMATAPIGALAINAATDFSLYFVIAYQKLLDDYSTDVALEKAIQQEGTIILADCVLNTLCFLPLIASGFLPVRQLGWMMGVMLMACAVATLIFMAALLPPCTLQREVRV